MHDEIIVRVMTRGEVDLRWTGPLRKAGTRAFMTPTASMLKIRTAFSWASSMANPSAAFPRWPTTISLASWAYISSSRNTAPRGTAFNYFEQA